MCHERVQVSAVHMQRQETPLLSGCLMRAARSRQHFSRGLEDVDNGQARGSRAKLSWALLAALRHGGEMSGALAGCELSLTSCMACVWHVGDISEGTRTMSFLQRRAKMWSLYYPETLLLSFCAALQMSF